MKMILIALAIATLAGCASSSQPDPEPTYTPVVLPDDWRTDEWTGPVSRS